MLKVLVVDDHPIVREGIRQIILDMDKIADVRAIGTGWEAIQLVQSHQFDLVILDISLPDINGLEVLQIIRTQKPDIKILVLSRHQEYHYAVMAMKLGALAYINKSKVTEELIIAIKKVLQGRRYITEDIANELLELRFGQQNDKPLHFSLSEREFQVFQHLANGETVSECAKTMCLSPNTISTYRQRILEKLHLKNNAQLMHYAMEQKLVD